MISKVMKFGKDIDTDQIIGSRFNQGDIFKGQNHSLTSLPLAALEGRIV